jgi:hypothetical protein
MRAFCVPRILVFFCLCCNIRFINAFLVLTELLVFGIEVHDDCSHEAHVSVIVNA